jgi:hypothetical protein
MSTITTGQTPAHGGAATLARPQPPNLKEAAQRCHYDPTASNLVGIGTSLICEMLDPNSTIGSKEGNLIVRTGNLLIRAAEHRAKHGEELAAPSNHEAEKIRAEALRVRESQLTAELEAIREQRGA